MTTGDLIRAARLRARLSQKELAERLGLASSSIARWETDTVEPGFSTLRRVLQACGFDIPPVLVAYQRDPQREPVIELTSDAGQIKIVPEPAGTRGYEDLRIRANHEALGHGIRPLVANPGDLVRMLESRDRQPDPLVLETMRRVIELEHD